jgi:predicted TIM-barrel fold metal-dependent hydrolase
MTLFKDMLPQAYHAATAGLGILLTGVIEASPRNEDTVWVLDQIKSDPSFFSYAAQLDISTHDFIKNLDAFTKNGMTCASCGDMVPGLRAYLWSASIAPDDPVQSANLAELQKRGMTLDVISRGQPPNETNPKAQVDALATKFPNLRMIIDHLGGAKLPSASPDPRWQSDMALLASHPNIYMKFSAFFDTANATGDESKPWTAPKDAASYAPLFDVLLAKFGEDRLIWGSNWPVCTLAGTVAEEIKIAEDYLAPKGQTTRDKVMFRNGILFYRRIPPT